MAPIRLILVGGFLGAGKTTLLWEAATQLTAQGKRVGLITNDQAPDLVDTKLLQGRGFDVQEVAGSCFCCNFQGLLDAADRLRGDVNADVLLAEPVGSCTDLSATILQPLKDRFRQDFALAPLTVLADPFRLRQVLTGEPARMHPSAAYIFEKQLEEADRIVVNKSDRVSDEMRADLAERVGVAYPERPIRWMSVRTGDGLDEWLADSLAAGEAGVHIPKVDYETYAEGEAVLGWVNATARIECPRGVDGERYCLDLLSLIREAATKRSGEIGHVKVVLSSEDEFVSGNVTSLDAPPELSGRLNRPVAKGAIVLNARVELKPDDLEELCREAIQHAAPGDCAIQVDELHSLSPGRPVPTHRYTDVV